MTAPQRVPVLGPLDRLVAEPCLPTLSLTAGDVIAIVAQQLELAGHRVALSEDTKPTAERGGTLILSAFGLLSGIDEPS